MEYLIVSMLLDWLGLGWALRKFSCFFSFLDEGGRG
jgi:hypothetical protein